MRLETPTYFHNTGLSEVLRVLASDARGLIATGDASPAEIASLMRRIRSLRDRLSADPPSPLLRWLDGLERQVDEALLVGSAS
jgi:hypothetical protein